MARVGGCLLRNKREWVYFCYDKLAGDLVFDNAKMMGTGFRPRHSLETILAAPVPFSEATGQADERRLTQISLLQRKKKKTN